MPLTQRLKRRNQSDTALVESHHDAPSTLQDLHDVKEEVERKLKKETIDGLASVKKRQVKAQREKNAFCSKKVRRSVSTYY